MPQFFSINSRVQLQKLVARADLNGREGTVVSLSNGRLGVLVDGSTQPIAVRPACMLRIDDGGRATSMVPVKVEEKMCDREVMSSLDPGRLADALLRDPASPGYLDAVVDEQATRVSALKRERLKFKLPVRTIRCREEFLEDLAELERAVVGGDEV